MNGNRFYWWRMEGQWTVIEVDREGYGYVTGYPDPIPAEQVTAAIASGEMMESAKPAEH